MLHTFCSTVRCYYVQPNKFSYFRRQGEREPIISPLHLWVHQTFLASVLRSFNLPAGVYFEIMIKSETRAKSSSSDSVKSGISGVWSIFSTSTFGSRWGNKRNRKKETNQQSDKKTKGKSYAQLINDEAEKIGAGKLDDFFGAGTKSESRGKTRSPDSVSGMSGAWSFFSASTSGSRWGKRGWGKKMQKDSDKKSNWKNYEELTLSETIETHEYRMDESTKHLRPQSGSSIQKEAKTENHATCARPVASKPKTTHGFLKRISFRNKNRTATTPKIALAPKGDDSISSSDIPSSPERDQPSTERDDNDDVASSISTDLESEEQPTESANQRILCSSYTPRLNLQCVPIPEATVTSNNDHRFMLEQRRQTLAEQIDTVDHLIASTDRSLLNGCDDNKSEQRRHRGASRTTTSRDYSNRSPSPPRTAGCQETRKKSVKEQGRITIVKDLNWTIPSPRPRKGVYTGITLFGRVPHGFGTLEFTTGDAYVGSFKGGEMHGVNGTYTSACGNHYKGEFQRNFRHGNGTETLRNGMQYVGRHAYGLPHGFGILYDASGSILQVGDWHGGAFVSRKKKTVISFETDVVKTDVDKYSSSSSACSSSSSVSGFSLDSSKAPHSIYDETVSVSSSRGSHISSRAASDRNIPVATDPLKSKDKVSPAKSERYIPVAKDTPRSGDAMSSAKSGRDIPVATDGAGSSVSVLLAS